MADGLTANGASGGAGNGAGGHGAAGRAAPGGGAAEAAAVALLDDDRLIPFEGDATSPAGFRAAGVHCGVKRKRPDLALLLSETEATAAGVFTTNRVQAAPVILSRETVAAGRARAVVVNSGNANACTGDPGMADAREMVALTAGALGLEPRDVLVASTGVIGVPLPMDAIRRGIPAAAALLSGRAGEAEGGSGAATPGGTGPGIDEDGGGAGGAAAARAILTTDRFPKTAAVRVDIGAGEVVIGGMAKGAGMIHPDMATTLCFLTTDAAVPAPALRTALREAVAGTFNAITVDGDTSTNDTVLVLANGRAGLPPVAEGEPLARFTAGLTRVARELATLVVRDGEGANHLVRLEVEGAATDGEARRAASRAATSLLVKTAIHGGDPNWGRLMAALGAAGVEMDESRTRIAFGDVEVVRDGVGVPGTLEAAAAAMREPELVIRVHLGVGDGSAGMWTCDLGEEYVRLNGSYTS